MSEAVVAGWQARIRAAAVSRTPLRIRGGGTKDFYGQALEGDVLDTTPCEGIVDYDPTELVITVRAGTRLAHVERTLRAEGQMLACEPPRFGEEATIGGFVAAGLSGPRRPYAGAVRDHRPRRAHRRRQGRSPRVRRPRDEERRGLRRGAPDDRRARHARHHHRGLAASACRCRRPRRRACSSARPTRRSG